MQTKMQTEVIDKYWCLIRPPETPESVEQVVDFISTARVRGDEFIRIFLAEGVLDDLEPEFRDIHKMVFRTDGPLKVVGDVTFFPLTRQVFKEETFAHKINQALLKLRDSSAELGVYNRNNQIRIFVGVKNFTCGESSFERAS